MPFFKIKLKSMRGATVAEYSIVLSLCAIVVIYPLRDLGTGARHTLEKVADDGRIESPYPFNAFIGSPGGQGGRGPTGVGGGQRGFGAMGASGGEGGLGSFGGGTDGEINGNSFVNNSGGATGGVGGGGGLPGTGGNSSGAGRKQG